MSGDRLRILALAPLPYRSDGAVVFQNGGTVFFAELLPRLARRGHRIRVLADAPPARESEHRAGLDPGEAGLHVDWFTYEHRSSQLPPTPEYCERTERLLRERIHAAARETRPDVVLVGRDGVLPLVIDTCEHLGLPTVAISHGPAVAALCAGRYPPPTHAALRDALARADLLIAVARHVAAGLENLGLRRILLLSNAADEARFRPAPRDPALLASLGIGADDPVVAHVSALRPLKRPLDLVESAARVLIHVPRCVYLVIGDGPSRAAAEARAAALGIAASFRFLGPVLHDALPAHLNLADVVVQPSEREGLSLVYREVQACGRPLVASDIPAAREVIDPGRTGLLFPVGDVPALAARTLDLLTDPTLRARLGTAARFSAEARPMETWVDAYEQTLRDAASRRPLHMAAT